MQTNRKQDSWAVAYTDMIDICERNAILNDWEEGFLSSLRIQIDRGAIPTDKQIEKLEAIHNKAAKNGN